MNMKKMMLASMVVMGGTAFADVSVDNIVCTQRYPWNGLVDIDYTVACDDPNAEIYVNPVGFTGGSRASRRGCCRHRRSPRTRRGKVLRPVGEVR